jgi:hypothetical protein
MGTVLHVGGMVIDLYTAVSIGITVVIGMVYLYSRVRKIVQARQSGPHSTEERGM